MVSESGRVTIAFPKAISAPNRCLRQSISALALLTRGESRDLAAIEALRGSVLTNELPLTGENVPLRVWFSVLCDIAGQGWRITARMDGVQMDPPEALSADPMAEKERVRNGHLIERDRLLRDERTRTFVQEMETTRLYRGKWRSVFSLMRDGRELMERLEHAKGGDNVTDVIRPYIQFVDSNTVCEHTGIRLVDIWRYFRLTWSTLPQSVPGRRMLILVRDAAADNHPIIGISMLGSAVVQLSVRDRWIGWTQDTLVGAMRRRPSVEHIRWLIKSVREAISDIYVRDFLNSGLLTQADLRKPSREVIKRLRHHARHSRAAHERYARSGLHKQALINQKRGYWRQQAQTFLFASKRAIALASALEIRLVLSELGVRRASKRSLALVLDSKAGQRAVAQVVRYQKGKHVGIDMADLTVCGAIAPYTHLLGGKLVALLMTSPEVMLAHRVRYRDSVSIIASSMKGRLVQRRPNLVILTTTSLYGVASSQYNRLVIPAGALSSVLQSEVRYVKLGHSLGFGSYHFSRQTVQEMSALVQQRHAGRRVNFIFGEGVNPKMRLVREALDAVGLPAEALLQHRTPRLVYGVELAVNFREILTGRATRPNYLFSVTADPREVTAAITDFWRMRWLSKRIENPEVLQRVGEHTTLLPVHHGARVRRLAEEIGLPLFDQEPAD